MARIHGIREQVHLHYADLTDAAALARVVYEVMPDEVYNLGAMSDVRVSYDMPVYSGDVTGLGCTRLLELVRQARPDARFYQAGSSEMFGTNPDIPCNEESRFYPASPYAAAKTYAHHMTVNYRESYGMFACAAVLFNHESERRGVEFVTRKITLGLAEIVAGRSRSLVLGNLDAKRDWGHARDYVHAMYLMLQADQPSDYVIATGESYSVRDFLTTAFAQVGLDWHNYVTTDPGLYRPVDPPVLLGDASKARRDLGWEPQVRFHDLVRGMVEADLR